MVDLCTLTGTLRDTKGVAIANAVVTLRPVPGETRVTSTGMIALPMVPDPVTTSAAGVITLILAPGYYEGSVREPTGRKTPIEVTVPDLASAALEDYIGKVDVVLLTSAQSSAAAIQPYGNRAACVAALAALPPTITTVGWFVAVPTNFVYVLRIVRSAGATAISDMPGWLPDGRATPDHFAQNTIPGTTDMSAAWLAMTAASGGKVCELLTGSVYVFNTQIDITTASVTIRGNDAELRKGASFSGTSLIRGSAADLVLEDFFLDGIDKSVSSAIALNAGTAPGFKARGLKLRRSQYGISAVSNSRVLIDECDIAETSNYSIRAHNIADTEVNDDITIRNCRLDRSDADPATVLSGCVLVRGTGTRLSTNVKVLDNEMIHVADPTNSAGLCCEIRHADGPVFSGNTGIDGAMLVSIAGGPNAVVTGNSGLGQTFYGIEIAGINGVACDNPTVTANTLKGAGVLNRGIALQGVVPSRNAVVSGNAISGYLDEGVFTNDQWDDVTVGSNSIDIHPGATGIKAVYVIGPVTGLSVTGNTLNGGGTGEKAIHLIDVDTANVSGNTTRGWTENEVLLQSLTSIDNVNISANMFGSGLAGTAIGTTGAGTFGPNIRAFGNIGYRKGNTEQVNVVDLANDVVDAVSSLAPEGLVSAGVGSTLRRRSGLVGNTLYVKESGTGNTGWVPVTAPRRVLRRVTVDRALTDTTALQPMFDSPASILLETGLYEFSATIYMTGMSATSGNARFRLVNGTGTVVGDSLQVVGVDAADPLAGTPTWTFTNGTTVLTAASMVTAGVGTELSARITGYFVVTVAGTIIPQLQLVTGGVTPTLQNGSLFEAQRIAGNTTTLGDWQ